MRKTNDFIQLSASDLSNYIACHHLSFLDLSAAEGKIQKPEYRDPLLAILQERGQLFEDDYLQKLKDSGLTVENHFDGSNDSGLSRTIRSMLQGCDVIYQATLDHGVWNGRADFLRKVDRPSKLGPWSYEVMDSKLAKETKAGTILQLCLYSQIIADIQGIVPEFMYVITPDEESPLQTYRVDNFMAYHRLIQKQLLRQIEKGIEHEDTYPHPVAHCSICNWWHHCDGHRRTDDHLSLVAGLSNAQRQELNRQNIHTLAQLGEMILPLTFRPSRGSSGTFVKLREQARVQLQARLTTLPVYETLDVQEGIGLARLPEPSAGDIFFDFESDPFAGTGGMEYLFGWQLSDEPEENYYCTWALSHQAEKDAFIGFVSMVTARLAEFPDLHIFHYSPYEPVALKRLMGKYNVCETEMDHLLRAGIFIDLHSITRQALRAGIEAYSLKELEAFHEFQRKMELRQASRQLKVIERHLERNVAEAIPADALAAVEHYNMEDCLSTRRLRDWLERLRAEFIVNGNIIPRPEPRAGEASAALSEHQEMINRIYQELTKDVSLNREERNPEQQALWLLANMLDWHRQEDKSKWWEYFRLIELSPEDLAEEKSALAGLEFTGSRIQVNRSVIDLYRFPPQDSDVKAGDSLRSDAGDSMGEVIEVDLDGATISIKKGPSIADRHPVSVFAFDMFQDKAKPAALLRLASWVLENGIDHPDIPFRAARDLLLCKTPRTASMPGDYSSPQEKAVAWVQVLSHGALAIQGPPGAGKSHTAAKMILQLIASGKKVGITALSHKVIRELMSKVFIMAAENNTTISCIQKVSNVSENPLPGLQETKDNGAVLAALTGGGAQLAAGTSWLWAREEMAGSVDVLFIDEAGQFSLVDTLAIAQAAESIVLLGDPQQLKQPQQGSHPEGTEVSALEQILQGRQTIAEDSGIFLNETWRLHPRICSFISELFYEGRLTSRPGLERQLIGGDSRFAGAGLWFRPVIHEGNQSSSPEEIAAIVALVNELTAGNTTWTDSLGTTKVVGRSDIKIIAPYNKQVTSLQAALPAMAVGTVDKFQGQEAPVIIFSMCTSNPEDAPRGMDFLYSGNRLNVAVSRAKSLFILAASPKLFEPDCRNPEQMKLANAFCRYMEMANIL
jgi:predicted RecB family nuclease